MTHRVVMSRSWTDAEPDTLSVEVQTGAEDDRAFVTFTCSSTWLAPDVVEDEVIPWLETCVQKALEINAGEAGPYGW